MFFRKYIEIPLKSSLFLLFRLQTILLNSVNVIGEEAQLNIGLSSSSSYSGGRTVGCICSEIEFAIDVKKLLKLLAISLESEITVLPHRLLYYL